MKYKILIKKCEDPQRASAIAAEVARWSGSAPEVVYGAVMQKDICIRREADETEARSLQAQFGAIGVVELVPYEDTGAAVAVAADAAAAAMPAVAAAAGIAPRPKDEDDDDEPGRVLTDTEYSAMLKQRPDVFYIEKSAQTRNTQLVCFLLAIGMGIFLSTRTVIEIAADFFDLMPQPERNVTLVKDVSAVLEEKKPEEKQKEETPPTDRKQLKPSPNRGTSGTGGGDPRARITQMGVLGIVSGQVTGKAVASADIFGKGGFATDIDAIISGVSGLRGGGDAGAGRAQAVGIGFGRGPGSGFNGSPGSNIDDLLGSLMNSSGGGSLDIRPRNELRIAQPVITGLGALTGGRSRASIQRVVMQNMAALRHAYNRRLRENPNLNGRITVRFAIDEFGNVTFAQMVESTLSDPELERTVVERVRTWKFEQIDKPGDITEVTYPFVFAQ
jgi:TonB family protein